MSPDIQSALSLLLIGMITVFIILGLVVLSGRILISMVNRFDPQLELNRFSGTPKTIFKPKSINRKHLAALTATVDVVTAGQGKIIKIEKVKK